MDNKARTEASNALVEWFNSQEIAPADAALVMTKVLAKIVVGALTSPHLPETKRQLDETIDRLNLQLIHEINDRLFVQRKGAGRT